MKYNKISRCHGKALATDSECRSMLEIANVYDRQQSNMEINVLCGLYCTSLKISDTWVCSICELAALYCRCFRLTDTSIECSSADISHWLWRKEGGAMLMLWM